MGDLSIVSILRWIEYLFPSLSVYIDLIAPLIIMFVGIISIFTNILPEPGHQFHLPKREDLKLELKNFNRKVYYLAVLSRYLTIVINAFMRSWWYKTFYNSTGFVSLILRKFKLTYRNKTFSEIKVPDPITPTKEFGEFLNDEKGFD